MDTAGLRRRTMPPQEEDGDDSEAETVRRQLLSRWLGVQHHSPANDSTLPENVPLPASVSGSRSPTPSDCRAGSSDENGPQCRICFAGSSPSEEEDPEIGRLIMPCKCRGTIAYIHIGCLQRWRRSAVNNRSFWQCDQCGYRYRVRRTGVAGLAENKVALGSCTIFIFVILIIVSGYIADWILETTRNAPELDYQEGWTTWPLSAYTYDGRLVGDAVGEAVRVLCSKLHVDLGSLAQHKAGPSRPKEVEQDFTHMRSKPQSSPKVIDHREHDMVSQAIISTGMSPSTLSKLQGWIEHSIMGLAFIGIVSFGQFIISITFFTPFNFGVRNSMFRFIRGNRRDGDAAGLGSGLILLLIVVGVLKAVHSVWKSVRALSRYLLRYVEERVLDVRE